MSYLQFVEKLVERNPVLRPSYDEHIRNNDEMLAWVYFGDVTRMTVELAQKAETRAAALAIIADLETALAQVRSEDNLDDDAIGNIIHVSFLENLPFPGEEGEGVIDLLPPRLLAGLRMIRGES